MTRGLKLAYICVLLALLLAPLIVVTGVSLNGRRACAFRRRTCRRDGMARSSTTGNGWCR